jgi:hypothetical protein
MSLAEVFLKTAREILLMSENLKGLDTKVDRLVDDVYGIDRRITKIELMIDLSKQPRRKRHTLEIE